jgi:branched-subunit amino acid transport protein
MSKEFLLYLAAMAGVTYAVRMIPFTLVRGKIKSVYIQSFLYYVPYAVLGAMTFPAIFTSTGSVISAVVGCLVAVFLAFKEKSLLTVALTACGAVLVVELLQMYVI